MSEPLNNILRRAFGGSLSDSTLQTLRDAGRKRSFAPGEVFVRQGETGNALFVITSGRVSVSQMLDHGEEVVLDILRPGQFVGELALLDQAPRMANCRADTAVTVLEFDQEVFSNLINNHPSVANVVLLHVLRNMRRQDQITIAELRSKNEALSEAYHDLKAAQAELVVKERLEHEMALAAGVQESLLPGALPQFTRYHFAAYQKPARQVGGDFYDVIELDDEHVGLLLADVADKGLHAALIMAVSRTLFRTEAKRSLSPAEVALAVHRGLLDLDRQHETFLTAFYGVLHRPSGRLAYVRAAQEKPLLIRNEQPVHALPGGGRFLGMLRDLRMTEYEVVLQPGDRLLMFSDGVPDATNGRLESYGYDRLLETADAYRLQSAGELVNTVLGDVQDWIGNADAFDDLTLLVVAVDSEPA